MPDLVDCPSCGKIFVKNKFRDICESCYKEEEKMFDIVNKFIRKRENRAATIPQVLEGTGIEEDLLLKFIKKGRLSLTHFPNLGYPCEKCGKIIRTGKLCQTCSEAFRKELNLYDKEVERLQELKEKEKKATYLANGIKDK